MLIAAFRYTSFDCGLIALCNKAAGGQAVSKLRTITVGRLYQTPFVDFLGHAFWQESLRVNSYEAAVADFMARRSSIRSRSTSQYLSAESSSLSG